MVWWETVIEALLIVAEAQGNVTEILVERMVEEVQTVESVVEAVLVVLEGMVTVTENVLT
jgi:hypothetical protein